MRKFLLLTLLCCATGLLWAKPLSPEQAMLRTQQNVAGSRMNTSGMKLVYTDAQNEQPAYYVFGRDKQQGYVIAGADDLASPVLGYVDDGTFDYANLPEQMKAWLQGYADEIAWARRHENTASTYRQASTRPQRSEIPLMVHAHWDQSAPYNNKTPLLNGKHTATGCVATAIAQIMRFWQHPLKGKGSHSYEWESGETTLSMDFSKVTFDWANMPFIHTDSWTSKQDDAVATLMEACSYAMDMDYNTSSGAVTAVATQRLVSYFDYAPSNRHYFRDFYGLYEWEDLVYNSLANGCPVLYHGQGSGGGHAFVVDGYKDNGYFHLNWGWSGSANGYYLLTALDPATLGIGGGAGGFNYSQGAVLNLRPNFTGSTHSYILAAEDNVLTLSGTTLTFSGGAYNYDYFTVPGAYFGLSFKDAQGKCQYAWLNTAYQIKSFYGLTSYSVNIPSGLADGIYYVNPACKVNENGTYVTKDMEMAPNLRDRYTLKINNGSATLSKSSEVYITASGLSMGPKLYPGSKCNLRANISNSNPFEFYDFVYVGWTNSSGTFLGVANGIMTDIPAQSTLQWDMPVIMPSLSAGNYTIELMVKVGDKTYRPISDAVNVTVLSGSPSAVLSGSNFVVNNASNVYAMDVSVEFNVNCTSGYFANNIQMVVFKETGGYSIDSQPTEEYYLSEGDSKHVSFRFPFPAGEANTRYMVAPYYRQSPTSSLKQLMSPVYFTVGTTGVESVTDATEPELWIDGDNAMICGAERIMGVEVYNLQGQRRAANCSIDGTSATLSLGELESGIYLVRVITDKGAKTIRLMRP